MMLKNQKISFIGWKNINNQKYIEYYRGSEKLGTQLNTSIEALLRKYADINKVPLTSIIIEIPERLERDIEKVANSVGAGSIIIDKTGKFEVVENYNPLLHIKRLYKLKYEK